MFLCLPGNTAGNYTSFMVSWDTHTRAHKHKVKKTSQGHADKMNLLEDQIADWGKKTPRKNAEPRRRRGEIESWVKREAVGAMELQDVGVKGKKNETDRA